MRRVLLSATIALCLAPIESALAATATSPNYIQATVTAAGECTVDGSNFSLGTIIPPIVANIDQGTGVIITCPLDTPYTIAISAGGSGSFAQRQMSEAGNPADKLDYNIFTDATYTTVWGDGTGATAVVAGTGTGAVQFPTQYYRVPPQATPPPGDYSDTTTVTVTY